MIDGLIAGKLHSKPTQRTGQSGKPFATAQVRAASGGGESLFVSVIAFERQAMDALLALDEGDSVALAGSLTPKVWQPRNGGEARPALDLVAHAVLTPYHVQRKRKACGEKQDAGGAKPESQGAYKAAALAQRCSDDLPDDRPW